MASPVQKHDSCGHVMATFDLPTKCACCHDKGIGTDPCVSKNDCKYYKSLTSDQRWQLPTLSYKVRKSKNKEKEVHYHSVVH